MIRGIGASKTNFYEGNFSQRVSKYLNLEPRGLRNVIL